MGMVSCPIRLLVIVKQWEELLMLCVMVTRLMLLIQFRIRLNSLTFIFDGEVTLQNTNFSDGATKLS